MPAPDKELTTLTYKLIKKFCRIRAKDELAAGSSSYALAAAKQDFSNVERLWSSFTVNRGDLRSYLHHPAKGRAAYLLGFHLPNMLRCQRVWQRMNSQWHLAEHLKKTQQLVQVIDVGCGTGAISQTLVSELLTAGVESNRIWATGFDKNPSFLDCYREAMAQLIDPQHISAGKMDFRQFEPDELVIPADRTTILCLGYVTNELSGRSHQGKKLERLIQRVLSIPSGMVVMLEPANQEPSRQSMANREGILQHGAVVYPCSHSKPCPMLSRKKDWCYSSFPWSPPRFISYLDKRLGIDRSTLKTCAFIYASQALHCKLQTHSMNKKVIVGMPLNKQGRREFLLCSEGLLSKAPFKQGRYRSEHL